MKREETKELFNKDEEAGLLAGEDYILYNDLHGNIVIWINSDEEMQVSVDRDDFIKIAKDLFPALNFTKLLKLLNRGDYLWTDKLQIKSLRPKFDLDSYQPLPTTSDAMNYRRVKNTGTTPYGISF